MRIIEQKDKELLILDLCSRSPYGVKVKIAVEVKLKENDYKPKIKEYDYTLNEVHPSTGIIICGGFFDFSVTDCKPYLRPMSSMTEEERIESLNFAWKDDYGRLACYDENISKYIDWLNAHHFDYRGLIEMGLAIEAPEGMYK